MFQNPHNMKFFCVALAEKHQKFCFAFEKAVGVPIDPRFLMYWEPVG
jgi:hypothetical protein